jgi:hypothetical protein
MIHGAFECDIVKEYDFLLPEIYKSGEGLADNEFCLCIPRPTHYMYVPELFEAARILFLKLMKYYLEFKYIERYLIWYGQMEQDEELEFIHKISAQYIRENAIKAFDNKQDLTGFKQAFEILGCICPVVPLDRAPTSYPNWRINGYPRHMVWDEMVDTNDKFGVYVNIDHMSLLIILALIIRLAKSYVELGDLVIHYIEPVDTEKSGYFYNPDVVIFGKLLKYLECAYHDRIADKGLKEGGDAI